MRLVERCADGWRPVVSSPKTRLLLFTPTAAVLSGTAIPHGLPSGVQQVFPLSVDDQRRADEWQLLCHRELEMDGPIDGYVSLSVDRSEGRAPVLIRETPETVGGKVWRGAWLLWRALCDLRMEPAFGLKDVKRVLEVGAGAGLVGILLAADHGIHVTLSESSRNAATWQNLRHNVEMNRGAMSGAIEIMELDWADGFTTGTFDVVIGSDVLYEPHLFGNLLEVMQKAAHRAVLVQNLARKGTEHFLELCRQRGIRVSSTDVSHLDAGMGVSDAQDGVYHCWVLEFQTSQ